MIHISPAAIREIQRMKSQHPNPAAQFCLGVEPGGCSELYYTLSLVDAIAPEQQAFDCNGIQIVLAAQTLSYLNGLSLDYSEDLMGGGFRFHNPNATQNCGCGNSFTVSTNPKPQQQC